MILLDTHYWIWWMSKSPKISEEEVDIFDAFSREGKLFISIISVWELEILERKGRFSLNIDFNEWIKKALDPRLIKVIPLDSTTIISQRKLPESFHADPADRLITTSALLNNFQLATKDKKIIDSGACKIWKVKP